MAIAGLVVASAAVVAAIAFNSPFWYTPFTIGSFLLFDRLSERFGATSLLRVLGDEWWRVGVMMYLAAVLAALVVDVIYGRMLAGAWVYPPWHGIFNIAVPVLLHYPFGFLSLYATFRTVRGMIEGRASASPRNKPGEFPGNWYGRLSTFALVLCLAAPLLNDWLNGNRNASELLLVVMLVATIAVDGVREVLTGDSMLRELYTWGWSYAIVIVVTLGWAIVINEGPNVSAHEWVYSPSPFGLPLWVMLILGWPFLLTVSAAVYETTMAVTSRDLVYTDARK